MFIVASKTLARRRRELGGCSRRKRRVFHRKRRKIEKNEISIEFCFIFRQLFVSRAASVCERAPSNHYGCNSEHQKGFFTIIPLRLTCSPNCGENVFFSPSRPNREHARNLGKDFRVSFAGMNGEGLLDARCGSLDYILMDFCEFFISLFRFIRRQTSFSCPHDEFMDSFDLFIGSGSAPITLDALLCKHHRDMSSIRRPHQLIFNFYALRPLRLIKRLIMLRTFLGHFLNCFP